VTRRGPLTSLTLGMSHLAFARGTLYRNIPMDRRTILTSAGALATAGVLAGVTQAQDKRSSSKTSSGLDKMHAACLEACQDCAAKCNETVNYCMTHLSQGHKDHAACAAVAMSCQEFCSLSTQLIGRSCTLAAAACNACATACDACASECEKMKGDEQMIACAKVCRECADSCRTMV
jgi:hypothetical protein